jgi:hypothetical protein
MNERIKDMANKGLITKVISENDFEKLSKLSEKELIDLGYMTQTSIFDGSGETVEEEVIKIPVVDDAPVVDDEPDDTPVVDDGMEDGIVAEGDTDAGIVEG